MLSGVVWYNSFFGHTDDVGRFFGVPYAVEETHDAAEDRATAEAAPEGDDSAAEGETAAYPHYVLTGAPGEGAIHAAPGNNVLNEAHEVPTWVKFAPFVAMILGLAMATLFYIVSPGLPARWAEVNRPLYLFLLNKWYFDEIYDAVFVRPAKALGRFLWRVGDGRIIDGGINGLALGIIPFFTRLAGRAQSGYLFHYAFAMVLGIVVLVTWVTLRAGG